MSTDKGKHAAADVDEQAAAAIGGTHYAYTIHTCNTHMQHTICKHNIQPLPFPTLISPPIPIPYPPPPIITHHHPSHAPSSPLLPSPPNSSSTKGNIPTNSSNYFFHWPPPLCAVTIEAFIKNTFSSADRERTRAGKFGRYTFIERGELLSNDDLTSVPGVQMKAVGSKELTSIIPGASIVFEEKKYWIAGQCMSF
jgi:hypothetical protein